LEKFFACSTAIWRLSVTLHGLIIQVKVLIYFVLVLPSHWIKLSLIIQYSLVEVLRWNPSSRHDILLHIWSLIRLILRIDYGLLAQVISILRNINLSVIFAIKNE